MRALRVREATDLAPETAIAEDEEAEAEDEGAEALEVVTALVAFPTWPLAVKASVFSLLNVQTRPSMTCERKVAFYSDKKALPIRDVKGDEKTGKDAHLPRLVRVSETREEGSPCSRRIVYSCPTLLVPGDRMRIAHRRVVSGRRAGV
jgi:hypothetical protein